MLNHAVVTE